MQYHRPGQRLQELEEVCRFWDPVDWTLESKSGPLKAPYEIYFQTVAGGWGVERAFMTLQVKHSPKFLTLVLQVVHG